MGEPIDGWRYHTVRQHPIYSHPVHNRSVAIGRFRGSPDFYVAKVWDNDELGSGRDEVEAMEALASRLRVLAGEIETYVNNLKKGT